MTRQRSEFLATFRTAFLTGRTGTVALALATSVVALSVAIMGCAPSGRTGSKGEVVEIETIETIGNIADGLKETAPAPPYCHDVPSPSQNALEPIQSIC